MRKKIEFYFIDVVKHRRHGCIPSLIRGLLLLLSWPYRLFVFTRNLAYDSGWFRRYIPPVPVVISIGNIVVGGTGKTPVTLLLAKEFMETFTLAILSRGYRSPAERLVTPVILSQGQGPMHPASYCGDEPYLLAVNLPKAVVIVGKNRYQASNMAAKAGAQIIVLDDGMQHRRLARDFEIVVMDVRDPYGQGFFLPRGFLREGVSALRRASLLILNHAYEMERYQMVRKQLAKETQAPVIGTKMVVVGAFDFSGNNIGSLHGRKLAVFCGIAHPESFINTLTQLEAHVVASDFVPDHHDFTDKQLAQFAQKAKAAGAELLLCTEKDRVKFTEVQELDLPLAWLKTELEIVDGRDVWDNFIEQVKRKIY